MTNIKKFLEIWFFKELQGEEIYINIKSNEKFHDMEHFMDSQSK